MPPSETVQLFIDALAGTFPDVGGDCIDPVEARRILAERPEIPLPPIEVASVEDTHHPRPGGRGPGPDLHARRRDRRARGDRLLPRRRLGPLRARHP